MSMSSILKTIREDGEYHFGRYGSFWHRFSIANWRWSMALCLFENHWALHLFCFWITLWKSRREPENIMESWGWSYADQALYLNWGNCTKIFYPPWSYDHCRCEIMLEDGSFVPWERWTRSGESPEPINRYRRIVPYRYTLKSGEVQNVQATVTVDRRSWCWRAWPFRRLRWPSKVSTCIDVSFSEEVGERRGSWKGGVMGCGWKLRPGEDPIVCLRRMEAERIFN
jgi:hypothetical protein